MLECSGHVEDLQRHMYKLYQDGFICDLEILTKDGVTFRAHKLVLTASSRYLYNMCMQMTSDASFIFDISSEDLHVLVEFCYTGQLYVSADRWTSIQEAAEFLQMFNVLELLNGQLDQGTSTLYPSAAWNHPIVNQNILTELTAPAKAYDGTSQWQSDSINDVIVKHEVTVQDKEKDKSEAGVDDSETVDTSKKVGKHYATRLSTQSLKPKASEHEPSPRSGTPKAVSFTGVKGHQRSTTILTGSSTKIESVTSKKIKVTQRVANAKIKVENKGKNAKLNNDPKYKRNGIDGDPDYEPRPKSGKKVTVKKKQNVVRTRSKRICNILTGLNILGGKDRSRILIRIKNSKLERIIGCKRIKRGVPNNQCRISVPRNSKKTCQHCRKVYTSSVCLHVHQLYAHFSKNCSQLRYNYLLKRAKQKSDINGYMFHTGQNGWNFECKLCGGVFSKYSHFTLHFNRKHRSKTRLLESWLRYCSVKLAIQKLLLPFAKDRKSNIVSNSKLDDSVLVHKTRQRNFKCSECDKKFLAQYSLTAHKRKHHGDVVKCKGSQKKRPERKMPPEPLFVCVKCRKPQRSIRALCNHLQVKHGCTSKEATRLQHYMPDSLQCEMCGFMTQDLHEMKEHVTEAHPFVKYQCTECSITFKVPQLLKRHRYTCHVLGNYNFRCQLCEKVFRKGSLLKQHEYFKHGIQHESIKIFYCGQEGCTYKTYGSTAIKLHMSKHVKDKLFPCAYCGLKLKTAKIREKHIMKMHLLIRPFLCQVCGLSFGEKHELQSHINNRHSSEKNYQCQYCPYTTAVKGTYFTHMFNVHKIRAEEDKRELFRCPHCPFTSILHYRYQTHVNGHTNTRNYECKICNKSFVSANTLRSHNQWLHSDKVFSCTQCDYQTKTTQKLNEHIRVQHQLQGFKPYKCPYCPFRCATGGNTRKHVKQVHKGETVTYIRDDELLTAARMARASGQYASLFNTLSSVPLAHEVNEDERSELSENILHIAL